jgi:hypothetical protein
MSAEAVRAGSCRGLVQTRVTRAAAPPAARSDARACRPTRKWAWFKSRGRACDGGGGKGGAPSPSDPGVGIGAGGARLPRGLARTSARASDGKASACAAGPGFVCHDPRDLGRWLWAAAKGAGRGLPTAGPCDPERAAVEPGQEMGCVALAANTHTHTRSHPTMPAVETGRCRHGATSTPRHMACNLSRKVHVDNALRSAKKLHAISRACVRHGPMAGRSGRGWCAAAGRRVPTLFLRFPRWTTGTRVFVSGMANGSTVG